MNLPKEAKDLYSANYKILMKEIKDDTDRYTMFLNLKKQYYENDYTIQSNMQIQCTPCQITKGILLRSFTGPEPGGPESTIRK